jgi:hypothetical protein
VWFESFWSLLTSTFDEFLDVFGDFVKELIGHLNGHLDGAGDQPKSNLSTIHLHLCSPPRLQPDRLHHDPDPSWCRGT